MFRFNLNRVIRSLVPPTLRMAKFLAWLSVSISYLSMTLERLRQFQDESIRDASMTPQIAYLEHMLNSRYGTGTAIWIGDGFFLGPWIWMDSDVPNPEFYMDDPLDSYVFCDSDSITINFVVNVPRALSTEVQDIAAKVQKYKLAGKYFIIQLY
jgi:hypothetical protein